MRRLVSLVCWVAGMWWLPVALGQNVRLMQWNVNGRIGNSASNNTAAAQAIARIIRYNQPDIITFNELENVGTNDTDIGPNTAAMIAFVTNNLPYFGNKTGVTFWVDIAKATDGFIRNGSISRYPISGAFTYSDAGGGFSNLRGMESFQVQLSGTNLLEVFHVHLKCCSSGTSCTQKQAEATIDATNITVWAGTHAFPYVLTGDLNEDEDPTRWECATNSFYHPVTTLKQGGGMQEYAPRSLNGSSLTWSATSQTIRFDYILPATNRISLTPSATDVCITTGYVFNTSVWGALYTGAIANSSTLDSRTASDHLCVQTTIRYPTSLTNFNVTPTGTFASSGSPGGPFSPASQVYTLTNTDAIPLFWSVTNTSNWLTVSLLATNLSLGAGQSTNITAFITNSVATGLTPGTYVDSINFSNTATGVSFARPVTLTVGATPPAASFTGSPTNGVEPLLVSFTDTSTGNITNRFWDFGDSSTTNLTTNTVSHSYPSGTYSVKLIASGPGGVSTNIKPNYVTVLTAFQSWQIQYFGSTNAPSADAGADPDGDGQDNLAEFLAGTDPTNSAAYFHIMAIASESNGVRITWATGPGRTNALQSSPGAPSVGYSNNYADIFIVTNTTGTVTDYLDVGAVSNPAGYYRVRVLP